MKDNFSAQAAQYARFRPVYSKELIAWLAAQSPARQAAWDCGTGNGQVALLLAEYFDHVFATDISRKQLQEAPAHPRIHYAEEPAEQCSAADQAFDLVVVAQAIHWFQFEKFYEAVRRVLRPGGLLAAIGYGLFHTDAADVNALVRRFYLEVVGPFWDPERRYVDEQYRTIPFPFAEVSMPDFLMVYRWRFEELLGYLNTWSAVQHYQQRYGQNPVQLVEEMLKAAWGDVEFRTVQFPVFTRVGRV